MIINEYDSIFDISWNGKYIWYIFEVFLEFFLWISSFVIPIVSSFLHFKSVQNLFFFPEIEIESEIVISSQTPAPNSLYFYLGITLKLISDLRLRGSTLPFRLILVPARGVAGADQAGGGGLVG